MSRDATDRWGGRCRQAPAAVASTVALMIAFLPIGGCARGEAGPQEAAAEAAPGSSHGVTPSHIDSIFPIAEQLHRFRGELGPPPDRLSGGESSLDALIEGFVRALAASDTTGFADMLMTRDEFAWLYYPHTRYTSRPYEMAPALLWFQIENGTSRGLGRLLDRLGGTSITVLDYRCAAEPLFEQRNRIWEDCAIRIDPPDLAPIEMRLFGSILEREGIFKFVSYTNDF